MDIITRSIPSLTYLSGSVAPQPVANPWRETSQSVRRYQAACHAHHHVATRWRTQPRTTTGGPRRTCLPCRGATPQPSYGICRWNSLSYPSTVAEHGLALLGVSLWGTALLARSTLHSVASPLHRRMVAADWLQQPTSVQGTALLGRVGSARPAHRSWLQPSRVPRLPRFACPCPGGGSLAGASVPRLKSAFGRAWRLPSSGSPPAGRSLRLLGPM